MGEQKTSSRVTLTLAERATLLGNELQTWQLQLTCALSHNGVPGLPLSRNTKHYLTEVHFTSPPRQSMLCYFKRVTEVLYSVWCLYSFKLAQSCYTFHLQ